MNHSQKTQLLFDKVGKSVPVLEKKRFFWIPYTKRHGWLWLEAYDDCWSVILANGQNSHFPFPGPALGIDLNKDGTRQIEGGPLDLTGVWKSALSMWPVRNEEEAVKIFNLVISKLDLAYRYHVATV